MTRRYTYCSGKEDRDFVISSMKKYVEKKQELDKFLENLLKSIIDDKKLKILDASCGIAHLIYNLSSDYPNSTFYGIDQTPYLIDEAKKLCSNRNNINLQVGDIYDLPKKFGKDFDVSISWKTISWLPHYDECLKSLVAVTRDHIFLSSLFYDGDIDFEIKVRQYKDLKSDESFDLFYNVYSYPRFRDFVYKSGAKNVESYDFEIDVDIPKPPESQMGTYTQKMEDGKRLQISGPIIMSWKIIRIDL